MRNLEDLKSAIQTYNLKTSGPFIEANARNAAALSHGKFGENNIPVGETKFAGQPDVPADFKWPKHKRRPLGFVAQIDLESNSIFLPGLPDTGLLSFFYDVIAVETGEDHHGKGNCAVYWFTGNLERKKNPTRIAEDWETCPVGMSCTPILSVPSSSMTEFPQLDDSESGRYNEFWDTCIRRNSAIVGHQFGGHADAIQGDMRRECAERTKTSQKEWNLLLQVGSDREIPFQWDDSGALYYWIRTHDLQARDFSQVICIEQCY